MAKKKQEDLEVNGKGLEVLLNRVINACEEDIEETEQNIAFYKGEVINSPLGRQEFGIMLGDALKIKGQARDRYIKCINLFKDRVKMKEVIEKSHGSNESPENLLKAIDQAFLEDNED